MAPAKLKGTLSSLMQSQNPISMHPSVFKALWSNSYWLRGIYPMGKHALISKGSTMCSAILAADV